uniref:ATP synthase mitochondrial F1 complex assembly factor 1 n=1 Tax=Ursus maritimus TaxID=29073 RepID=A0A452VG55_URSMA
MMLCYFQIQKVPGGFTFGFRSDPAAFESRLEKRIEFRKQPVGHSRQGDFIKCIEQKTDTLGKQPVSRGFTKDKTLSSIFNIEMVKDKTAEEIRQIWQQYFAAKDTVYAVIPKEKFDLIWTRAQSCPTFLCALPRREGYEFFVGQWTGTELHFTALINIQTRGDAAASQLVLYHYPELKEEKGIVLMTAEMDPTFLNVAEAQCIANQVQLFYATDRKETYGWTQFLAIVHFRNTFTRGREDDGRRNKIWLLVPPSFALNPHLPERDVYMDS